VPLTRANFGGHGVTARLGGELLSTSSKILLKIYFISVLCSTADATIGV
jgi:hypothetical protein